MSITIPEITHYTYRVTWSSDDGAAPPDRPEHELAARVGCGRYPPGGWHRAPTRRAREGHRRGCRCQPRRLARRFVGADLPASSTRIRELLDWHPTGPTPVGNLDAGAYTDGKPADWAP